MPKLPSFSSIAGDSGQKRTRWESVIISTPVVLTVLATVLAGLSSSEMSSSQYFRSLAAQMQSKVSDQWAFYQAKRFREMECQNTLGVLEGLNQLAPDDGQNLQAAAQELIERMNRTAAATSADSQKLHEPLARAQSLVAGIGRAATRPAEAVVLRYASDVPGPLDVQAPSGERGQPLADSQIADVVRAIGDGTPEATTEQLAGRIDPARLNDALALAAKNSADFQTAAAPVTLAADQLQKAIREIALSAGEFERAAGTRVVGATDIGDQLRRLRSIWTGIRLRLDASRYEGDARDNQVLAQLYEVWVRKDGFASERHRLRSKQFFYGMLGAQAGVTIATLSLAVQRRSLLWGIAAAAGLFAVSFAAYVYLFV
ncbi:MAG TPA: DUF4337 family protein [Tepidisphaeraceae bacterium]|jgi:hypothetical protein|nr:DUF4337 family protein [Tepidisphaeraceae bacterium]